MEARRLQVVHDDETSEVSGEETFTAPLCVLRWKAPAVALAYAWLYHETLAQGRQTCDTSIEQLMDLSGRDRRTVDGWLAALELPIEKGGYAAIRTTCDRPTGALRITVYRVRPFGARRPAKCDPQRPLLEEVLDAAPVPPIEEAKGAVIAPTRPTEDAGGPAAQPAARRSSWSHGGVCANSPEASGEFAQNPLGEFAQNPLGEFAQKPPSDVAALARLIEAKRAQAVRAAPPRALEATGDFAQNPPPRSIDLRSSEISKFKRSQIYALGADPTGAREFEADLIAELQRRVPGLYGTPARKVAKAVAAGWLDWDDVERALDKGAQRVAEGACPRLLVYFVGAMRRAFAEHGQPWLSPRKNPKPR